MKLNDRPTQISGGKSLLYHRSVHCTDSFKTVDSFMNKQEWATESLNRFVQIPGFLQYSVCYLETRVTLAVGWTELLAAALKILLNIVCYKHKNSY